MPRSEINRRSDGQSVRSKVSLPQNVSWTVVGSVIYAVCQWGMLASLVKFGGVREAGMFTLGLAVSTPVMMFAGLQLRVVQATDASHEFSYGHYLGLRLIATALALVALICLAAALGYSASLVITISLVGLIKAIDMIGDVQYGLFQNQERLAAMAKSVILNGLFSFVMFGGVLYLGGSLFAALVGSAFASLLIVIYVNSREVIDILQLSHSTASTRRPLRMLGPRWDWSIQRRLLILAAPLGLVTLLSSLGSTVPRFFVEWFLSLEELGSFAALAYCLQVGRTILSGLSNAFSPRMGKYWTNNQPAQFIRLIIVLLAVCLLVVILGSSVTGLAGQEITTILYSDEVARYWTLLFILILAAGFEFCGTVLGLGLTAMRVLRVQARVEAVSLLVGCGLCLALIPIAGLNGAAWAMVGSNAIRCAAFSLIFLRDFRLWEAARVDNGSDMVVGKEAGVVQHG